MKIGLLYSIISHILLIALFCIGIPYSHKSIEHEKIVTVDLVRTSQITNLQNAKVALKKTKQNQSVKTSLNTNTQNTSRAAVNSKINTNELTKEQSTQEIMELKKKKDKLPVQHAVKQAEIVQKEKASELDNLLKDLDKKSGDSPKKKNHTQTNSKGSSNKEYQDDLPLTISEKDNIKSQIERKFVNPIILDFSPKEIVIKIRVDMGMDGQVKNVITLNDNSYPQKHASVYFTLKESLIRAAYMASPIKNLPEEKYHGNKGWKEIELIFDAYYLMNN